MIPCFVDGCEYQHTNPHAVAAHASNSQEGGHDGLEYEDARERVDKTAEEILGGGNGTEDGDTAEETDPPEPVEPPEPEGGCPNCGQNSVYFDPQKADWFEGPEDRGCPECSDGETWIVWESGANE